MVESMNGSLARENRTINGANKLGDVKGRLAVPDTSEKPRIKPKEERGEW